MFKRLDTVILRVKDCEQARKWYEEKLELQAGFYDRQKKYLVMQVGDSSITLHELAPHEQAAGEGVTNCYPILFADRIEEVHQRLNTRGVRVESIQPAGGVRYFDFFDPDNNRLQVCSF